MPHNRKMFVRQLIMLVYLSLPSPLTTSSQVIDGLLRLASVYETTALRNTGLSYQYDLYIKANIQTFMKDIDLVYVGALPTYDWDYTVNLDNTEEVKGIHAFMDIW